MNGLFRKISGILNVTCGVQINLTPDPYHRAPLNAVFMVDPDGPVPVIFWPAVASFHCTH